MDNLHVRLNFVPGRNNEIDHQSLKDHLKISKKFICEFL